EFLARSLGPFFRGARSGTASFRPLQEKGRQLSAHASNELVHVDAGAYGATHGDRILRFFVNANPSQDRVWASKGTFAELLGRHGAEAVIGSGDLPASLPERTYRALLRPAGLA